MNILFFSYKYNLNKFIYQLINKMLLKMDFFIIFCSIFITNKVTNNLILSLIFKQFFCQRKMKSTTLYNILFKNLIFVHLYIMK
jgi:hypothetical protein